MPRRIAHYYMMLCHSFGFGYYRVGKTAREWADFMQHQLDTDVFYHSPKDLREWWQDAFGAPPSPFEQDFMAFRLEKSASLSRFGNKSTDLALSFFRLSKARWYRLANAEA